MLECCTFLLGQINRWWLVAVGQCQHHQDPSIICIPYRLSEIPWHTFHKKNILFSTVCNYNNNQRWQAVIWQSQHHQEPSIVSPSIVKILWQQHINIFISMVIVLLQLQLRLIDGTRTISTSQTSTCLLWCTLSINKVSFFDPTPFQYLYNYEKIFCKFWLKRSVIIYLTCLQVSRPKRLIKHVCFNTIIFRSNAVILDCYVSN